MVYLQVFPCLFPMFFVQVFYDTGFATFILVLKAFPILVRDKNIRPFPTTYKILFLARFLHLDFNSLSVKSFKHLQSLLKSINFALLLMSLFNILKQRLVSAWNKLHLPYHLFSHCFWTHMFINYITQSIQVVFNSQSRIMSCQHHVRWIPCTHMHTTVVAKEYP